MENIRSLTEQYSVFTMPEKFHFFGCNAHIILGSLEERDIYKFLRSVILDETENSNIRKKAIELHTDYILISKLKPRYALDILIESWPQEQDIFLEIRRLKDLFLFYESEPTEIMRIYQLGTNSDELEIQSEVVPLCKGWRKTSYLFLLVFPANLLIVVMDKQPNGSNMIL
jgi:hypothetical protein